MKHVRLFAALAAVLTIGATGMFAQRPNRPAGSNGKPSAQRPAGVPQRPAGSVGQTRPENAPQRPAESQGKRGQRPADAPQRPTGTYGKG